MGVKLSLSQRRKNIGWGVQQYGAEEDIQA